MTSTKTSTKTACFALLASAFLLAGILIIRIDQKAADNAAHAAGQVITQPAFTMMTARTRGGDGDVGEESLFILDNNSGVLIVYKPVLGSRKQLERVLARDMKSLFK